MTLKERIDQTTILQVCQPKTMSENSAECGDLPSTPHKAPYTTPVLGKWITSVFELDRLSPIFSTPNWTKMNLQSLCPGLFE